VGPFYAAASTAYHTAVILLSLRRNLSRLNCPLWIRRSSSMPAIVAAAVLNHLNPSIGTDAQLHAAVAVLDPVVQVFR
jgi:hypothetical protein